MKRTSFDLEGSGFCSVTGEEILCFSHDVCRPKDLLKDSPVSSVVPSNEACDHVTLTVRATGVAIEISSLDHDRALALLWDTIDKIHAKGLLVFGVDMDLVPDDKKRF